MTWEQHTIPQQQTLAENE
uniref:Uncharacterized protein n=1 Tax=Rhizophora mucronata TaxID=61149 RepID=A0A2P2PNR1_RHIMU